jgi:hypothetical protein
MHSKKGAFYVGQPHHMRLWEPILDKLKKRGMEILYITSHTNFPFEISAFSYGIKPYYIEDLLEPEDLELEEKIYRELSTEIFEIHKMSPAFKALSPLDISKTIRDIVRESILFPKFLKKYKVDIVFALHELNRWGKLLAYITFKMGIPFVTLQEGAYYAEGVTFSYHSEYSTANFIWGEQTLEHLLKFGNAPEKNVIVGDTHLDKALPKYRGKSKKFKRKVCKDFGFDPKKPLILLIHGSGIEKELILGAVLKLIHYDKNYNYILKLHPNVARYSTEEFQQKYQKENFKIVQLYDSYDLLSACDVAVTIGVSTLAFEATAFEKPLVELKYDSEIKGFFARYGISSLVEPYKLTEEIERELRKKGTKEWKEKLKNWQEYVFYKLDCKATERIIDYVDFILKEKSFYRNYSPEPFHFRKKTEKRLSVVLPVFGNAKLLETSLLKLFDILNPETDEVLLIFPPALSELYQQFANLKGYDILRNIQGEENNLGNLFNFGIEESRGKYVLLFKEGLVPLKMELEQAFSFVNGGRILGGYVIDREGKVCHAGVVFDRNNVVYRIYEGSPLKDLPAGLKEKDFRALDYLILTTRETLNIAGKFDERIHDYYTFIDYTLNASRKGFKNFALPILSFGVLSNLSFSPLTHRAHLQFYTKWRGETGYNLLEYIVSGEW